MRYRLRLKDQQSLAAIAAMVLLVFAVLFGGASRAHELRLALVELASLPLLVLAFGQMSQSDGWRIHRFSLALLGGLAALPLIQILPLPPGLWTSLPNREQLVLALDLAGLPAGWSPWSLTPDKTWRSFLALLPPVSMFLGVLVVTAESRRRLVYAILAATTAAIMLGTAQLASGGEQLYPWRTTDAGAVVGFFANRNHLATLCLIALPFAAVLGARVMRRGRGSNPWALWLSLLLMGLIVVALGVIRSRTGILLLAPVLIASLLAAWTAAGRGRPHAFLWGAAGVCAAAITAVGVLALGPILDRFDRLSATEGRLENWPIVTAAAEAHLPFGSGIGSFDAVFRSVEPLAQLDPTFFNQAHNDYLETWLETGWFGLALMVGFLAWFARRAFSAWRGEVGTDRDLQRASTIAIVAVLAHSVVDYPLRTVTIATIFAVCCAILELAGRTDGDGAARRTERGRV